MIQALRRLLLDSLSYNRDNRPNFRQVQSPLPQMAFSDSESFLLIDGHTNNICIVFSISGKIFNWNKLGIICIILTD